MRSIISGYLIIDLYGKKFEMKYLRSVSLIFLSLFFTTFLLGILQMQYFMEEGVYASYTLSFLLDGDLNIIDQVLDPSFKWLVTPTYYHPDFEHSGIVVYLWPFYAMSVVLQKFFLGATNLSNYHLHLTAHLVFSSLCALCGIYFIRSLLRKYSLPFFPAIIFIFSTAFLWYFLFLSTNTNIFGFSYSAIFLLFFFDTLRNTKNSHFHTVVIFSCFLSFGFIVRIQLAWIFFPFAYYLWHFRTSITKKHLLAFFPILFIAILYAMNQHARGAKGAYALLNYFDLSIGHNFYYAFFGPNGYVLLAPSFLLMFPAIYKVWKDKYFSPLLLASLVFYPIALFIIYNLTWAQMDGLVGRHQLSFLPIYAFIIAISFSQLKDHRHRICFISVLALFFVWNLVTHAWFYSVDRAMSESWKFIYPFDFKLIGQELILFLKRFDWSRLRQIFQNTLIYSPLILIVAFSVAFLSSISLRRFLSVFFLYSFVSYLFITSCNSYFGKRNVARLKDGGAFQHVIVGNHEKIYLYDDYIQVLKDSIYFFALMGQCDKVVRLWDVRSKYLSDITTYVIKDGSGFVYQAQSNNWKSNIENGKDIRDIMALCPEIKF